MNLKNIIIASTLLIGAIFTSSCERVADRNRKVTNTWRAKIITNGKLLFVENIDSLPVRLGDTVSVFYNEDYDNYYILNSAAPACDTASVEMFVDGVDTNYIRFEGWNVVLTQRMIE